jgi:hypothetical protein
MKPSFLDREPEELTQYLLHHARHDSAPRHAREQALAAVAGAALGGAFLPSTAYGATTAAKSVSTLVVAKWIAVGMASGAVTMGTVSGIEHMAATRARIEDRVVAPPVRELASPISQPRSAEAKPAPSTPSGDPAPAAPLPARAAPSVVQVDPIVTAPAPAPVASGTASPLGQLTRELSILDHARAALAAKAPLEASRALDAYESEFPAGTMRVEAAALRVEALARSGLVADARRRADAFLQAYPASPLAVRVRSLRDSLGTHNP